MNKFLRFLFILVILAMTGAIIFQLFFPTYMGSHSGYGISVGWQREIGIWNVAVLVILLAVNLKYDWFYLRASIIGLMVRIGIEWRLGSQLSLPLHRLVDLRAVLLVWDFLE